MLVFFQQIINSKSYIYNRFFEELNRFYYY